MATLVSSAPLWPLTGIDTFELTLEDFAHLPRIVCRDADRALYLNDPLEVCQFSWKECQTLGADRDAPPAGQR